jgi:hypothetical protein
MAKLAFEAWTDEPGNYRQWCKCAREVLIDDLSLFRTMRDAVAESPGCEPEKLRFTITITPTRSKR